MNDEHGCQLQVQWQQHCTNNDGVASMVAVTLSAPGMAAAAALQQQLQQHQWQGWPWPWQLQQCQQ